MGHFQTRPESGRIFGMKVTQASPQIPAKTYTNKILQPKPLIFNILLSQSAYFMPLIGSVNCEVITASSSESGVVTYYLQVIGSKSTAMRQSRVLDR